MPKPKEYHNTIAKEYIQNNFNMAKTLRARNKNITPESIEVKSSRLLGNDMFKRELAVVLQDITDEDLNEKLNELLNAKRITEYKGEAKMTDLPNYAERRKTLDIILNLRDLYPKKETINKDFKAEFKFKFKDMNAKQLKDLLNERQNSDKTG